MTRSISVAILAAALLCSPAFAKKPPPPPQKDPPVIEKVECLSIDEVIGMVNFDVHVIARLEGDEFLKFKGRVAGKQGKAPDGVDSIIALRKEGDDATLVVTFGKGCQKGVAIFPNKVINELLDDGSV